MKKVWFDEAWDDYTFWQKQDKKTIKRINKLLQEIERGYFDGIGKPEPLKGGFNGFWSRHIDDTNKISVSCKRWIVGNFILPGAL